MTARLSLALASCVLFTTCQADPPSAPGSEVAEARLALGTAALLRDINPQTWPNLSSNPFGFTPLGGRTVFFATTATEGTELWASDGTTGGTALVRDVSPGSSSGVTSTAQLVPFAGKLYFRATDASRGIELWQTDGTAAGTTVTINLSPGSPNGLDVGPVVAGSSLYFTGTTTTGFPYALFASDGTAAGTTRVTNLPCRPTLLAAAGARVYFNCDQLGSTGNEPWTSDGTAAGTALLRDIATGSASSTPTLFTAQGSTLFFIARSATNAELWKSDGTTSGTVLVQDLGNVTVRSLTASGTQVYALTSANVLWASDGTPGAAQVVATAVQASIAPAAVTPNRLAFTGATSEPWVSDGTDAGTFELVDVAPGNSTVVSWASVGTQAWCSANNAPWRTDGTTAGTVQAGAVDGGSNLVNFAPGAGSLTYFTALTAAGQEPWVADGTAAGARLLADLNPANGRTSTPLADAIELNGRVLFSADDPATGLELWRTDGTPAGTELLQDLRPGTLDKHAALVHEGTREGVLHRVHADDGRRGVAHRRERRRRRAVRPHARQHQLHHQRADRHGPRRLRHRAHVDRLLGGGVARAGRGPDDGRHLPLPHGAGACARALHERRRHRLLLRLDERRVRTGVAHRRHAGEHRPGDVAGRVRGEPAVQLHRLPEPAVLHVERRAADATGVQRRDQPAVEQPGDAVDAGGRPAVRGGRRRHQLRAVELRGRRLRARRRRQRRGERRPAKPRGVGRARRLPRPGRHRSAAVRQRWDRGGHAAADVAHGGDEHRRRGVRAALRARRRAVRRRVVARQRDGAVGSGRDGGEQLVGDVHPGTLNANPRSPVLAGDRLVFAADDGVHGQEPWAVTVTRDPSPGGGVQPPCAWPFLDAGVDGGAMDAGTMDAGTMDAGTMDAGTMDAGTMDAGTLDAGTTDAGTTDAGTTDAGTTDAGTTDAGTTDAGTTDAGTTDAGDVDAGDVDAGDVDAGDVDAGDVDAGDVDAGDVDAGDVDAGDVDAGDVDAGDVDAGDVDAGDVDAGDVDAGDVDAGDVDAGDVDAGGPDAGESDAGLDDAGTGGGAGGGSGGGGGDNSVSGGCGCSTVEPLPLVFLGLLLAHRGSRRRRRA